MQHDRASIDLDRLASASDDVLDDMEGRLAAQFKAHPGWVDLVLPLLTTGNERLVRLARRLLTLFDEQALLSIARAFATESASARFQLLAILWGFLIAMRPTDREEALAAIAYYVRPGLIDDRRPDRLFNDPERLELEHDYRICDETYLFLNRLRDGEFDSSYFEKLEDDRRSDTVRQFDRRFKNLFGDPGASSKKKAASKKKVLTELTIVATFPNAFATHDSQAERDAAAASTISNPKWSPAQRDFQAVADADTPISSGDIFIVSEVGELYGTILFEDPAKPKTSAFRPAQSVKRVNVISHANPGQIAMSGTVGQDGSVMLRVRGAGTGDLEGPLDKTAVQSANNPNLNLANGKPLAQSLRDRFAPDAEIYLLACHTGLSPSFVQEVKKLFQVKILGYSQAIAYCPSLNDHKIIDRSLTALGNCNSGGTRGFKHLTPDITA